MLMSADNQARFTQTIATLPSTVRESILNSSVKLTGSTPKGSTFTGSGVIVYSSDSTTTLVSAKHNLYVFAQQSDPPALSDELVSSFQAGVSIRYDGPMAFNMDPGRTATIDTVTPVTPNAANPWEYDVMILTSSDTSLAGFAKIFGVYDLPYDPAEEGYLLSESQYLQREGQTFVQTGYGESRETAENAAKTVMPSAGCAGRNKSGCLQVRTCAPLASETVTVYSQRSDDRNTYNAAINAVQLSADPTSSTGPGDSGGPLFVVTRAAKPRFFLIGTTFGADMATAPERCPPPGSLRVNNVATSLAHCYRSSLLGC